jgi:hypothetical protein
VTRTYVLLEVSPAAFAEVRAKLKDAGYDHALHREDGRETIDMHGIALVESLEQTSLTIEHAG